MKIDYQLYRKEMPRIQIRRELMALYGCKCLLTGVITSELTNHHIIKKEHGGPNTMENIALVIEEIHRWLHSLENCDMELFNLVNDCLELYKICLNEDMYNYINQYEEEIMPLILQKIHTDKVVNM